MIRVVIHVIAMSLDLLVWLMNWFKWFISQIVILRQEIVRILAS